MLLVSALSVPFALLGLLMAMARVQEALGGDPVAGPGAPATAPATPTAPAPVASLEPVALLSLDPMPAELAPA